MPYITDLCINMPPDFPAPVFSAFLDKARSTLIGPEGTTPQWKEFALASNNVAWRYRTAHEALEFLRGRYATTTGSLDHEDNYMRERALFSLFTSSVSCVESALYAIAAYTCKLGGFQFGPREQRECHRRGKLVDWITSSITAVALSQAIQDLEESSEWDLWVSVRNRLSHRGNLPSIIHAAIGAPIPQMNPILFAETTSTDAIDMGIHELDAHFGWITTTLRSLMLEAMVL